MNDTNNTDNFRDDLLITKTIISCVFVLTGIIGNIVVLLVYKRIVEKRRRDDRSEGQMRVRFYIPSLAVFDLASVIFFAIFPLTAYHVWLCKGITLIGLTALKTSGLILLLISIQRFMFIVPQPKRILTVRQLKVLLAVITLVAFALTLPNAFMYDILEITVSFRNRTVTFTHCSTNLHEGKILTAIVFSASVLNFSAICILHCAIGKAIVSRLGKSNKTGQKNSNCSKINRQTIPKDKNIKGKIIDDNIEGNTQSVEMPSMGKLQKHRECLDSVNASTQGRPRITRRAGGVSRDEQRKKTKSKFTQMFLIIVVIYALSYFPIQILWLKKYHLDADWSDRWELTTWFYILSMSNHIANPFVYGYFDSLFRHECKAMFCRKPCANK